jgi:hypothetical protein
MNFDFIEKIAGNQPDIYKSLAYGYLRSLPADELEKLMKKHALNKPLGKFVFHCVIEIKESKILDSLAKHFLRCFNNCIEHKEKRLYASYLNHLINNCGPHLQKIILTFFLNSGKRYLRKYAYIRNLHELDLFQLAWEKVNENFGEAVFLLKTIAYLYNDNFIEEHFNELIRHPKVDEPQIRKLFIRQSFLSEENWLWLKVNFPGSFLYIASIKNYFINDDDCLKVLNKIKKKDFHEGLEFWCLARMGKWNLIEKVIKDQRKE